MMQESNFINPFGLKIISPSFHSAFRIRHSEFELSQSSTTEQGILDVLQLFLKAVGTMVSILYYRTRHCLRNVKLKM